MLNVALATLLLCLPQQAPPASERASLPAEARIQTMIDKAEKKEPRDRPLPFAGVANELADLVDLYYGESDFDHAEATLKRLTDFAERSVAAAHDHGKKIKDAEIELRKCQRKLEAIRHTLAVADQGPVKAAEDRIDQLRTQLLDIMFSKGK